MRFERSPVPRDNAEFVNNSDSPLCAVPGFHLSGVVSEAMHGGPLGLTCQALDSVLWDLALAGQFGTDADPLWVPSWQIRASIRLGTAHMMFQQGCKDVKGYTSTCSKFSAAGLASRRLL